MLAQPCRPLAMHRQNRNRVLRHRDDTVENVRFRPPLAHGVAARLAGGRDTDIRSEPLVCQALANSERLEVDPSMRIENGVGMGSMFHSAIMSKSGNKSSFLYPMWKFTARPPRVIVAQVSDSTGKSDMKNRIKDLREQRGWSLDQLAGRIGDSTQASTVHKLETGTMKLTTEWMEKLGLAFGLDPIDIIDDRPRAGFAEDVARYDAEGRAPMPNVPARAGHALYMVTSGALDEIGIFKGDIVDVDESEIARRAIATGDIVIADVEAGPSGTMTTVMREFIEPALLITNSRAENAIPINTRTTRTHILGVVVGSHRQISRRR